MNNKSKFKTGQIVDIKAAGEIRTLTHRVKIDSVISDEEIVIEVPIVGGNALSMHSGSCYELTFYEDASMLTQHVEVVSRHLSGNVVCARLRLFGSIKKVNRRKYFRLSVLIDGESRGGRNPFSPMTTINLSAGGIRFVTFEKYIPDQYIQLRIVLGDESLDVVAKVISSALVQDSIRRYDVRAKFEQISEREEDIILKYLFEQQRVMKRKGLA